MGLQVDLKDSNLLFIIKNFGATSVTIIAYDTDAIYSHCFLKNGQKSSTIVDIIIFSLN